MQERKQRVRHAVQDALSPFLLPLDAVPALFQPSGGFCRDVAEHVRMPANELFVYQPRRRGEIALPSLLEEQREEVHLEEEITELVEQFLVVALERGVCDFVGLLDGMG